MKDNYKTIEVHRHFSLVEMQQTEPEVKAWLGQSFRAIGPYFKDKITATGLTFEEQRIILPEYLGIEATDKDFRRKVVEHYDSIITQIGKDGIKLNISLEDDSKPLSLDNLPVNIKDYVHYRHLIGHPDVASNKAEAEKGFNKRFYIVDPNTVVAEANKINDLEDRAMTLYMKFKDDIIRTDQILTMLGTNIKGMTKQEKVIALKEYAMRTPGLNETVQKEGFLHFIGIVEDRELEYKYLITEMIGAQYLRRVGHNIVYSETGEKVGDNLDDAVLFFKNAKNSRALNMLKAEYQAKVKKGKDYLPKEDPTIKAE